MFAKTATKLAIIAAVATYSTIAGAVVNDISGQYTLTSSATPVSGQSNEYVFNYTVSNVGQGTANAQLGLDGFTIYVPTSATFVSSTAPDSYLGSPGYWSTGFQPGATLDLRGDGSQNLTAPAGYNAYTFWGQYTESVYQKGSTATFSITLSNVSVSTNTVGISSYFGFTDVPAGQAYAQNEYGRYTTFTTSGVSAVAAVPEPETYAMLLAGLGMMGVVARRRNRKS